MTVINIPKKVNTLIQKLETAGFEAFVVGGCVRDALLGKTPKDWDITTNATYDQILNCLGDDVFVLPIANAKEHNVCIVSFEHERFEIATYRTDLESTDHRHALTATANRLSDDLSRRDFTVNALAYNDRTGLIDLFNGQKDIKDKVIRAVGNPEDRITEDALRILRAFRFASQFGFNLESTLKEVCMTRFEEVQFCSKERQRDEINKVLTKEIKNFEAAKKVLSLVNSVTDETLTKINRTTDLEVKWALILRNTDARSQLKKFKFDSTFSRQVQTVLAAENTSFETKVDIKRFLIKEDPEVFELVREFRRVIDNPITIPDIDVQQAFDEPHRLIQLAVNGHDVRSFGFEGIEVGTILFELLNQVVEKPELNTRENLLRLIEERRL